jgi:polyisoprenyl-phosphate glycosyltransferase
LVTCNHSQTFMTSYSVIIPALNEAGGIRSVIDRLHSLSPRPEVIVVDDGSTDQTGQIAMQAGVKVIRHPSAGGYGRSLKDGILAASHDVVAITDADGTYPVERIPDLLVSLEQGFDMVVGARHGRHYRGSFLKMPARILLQWLVEFTTGRRIPDINSGLRVFRKSQVVPFFTDLCNGFSFTTTITLIYMLTGKFVHYIPIDYAARVGRSKVRLIHDSFRTLQYITEVIATYNPLKLYVLMTTFLGIFFILSIVGSFLAPRDGYLFLTTLLLIGMVITFGMGVLAQIHSRRLSKP